MPTGRANWWDLYSQAQETKVPVEDAVWFQGSGLFPHLAPRKQSNHVSPQTFHRKPVAIPPVMCHHRFMRQAPHAHRVFHMLPFSPVEHPELSTEQELSMTQDVADQFFDWINDDLCEMLHDHIADVLKANNIDLDSREADDLFLDIAKRISVDVNVSK